MKELTVLCLFVSIIAFVSPPIWSFPQGSPVAPIILITTPLQEGEVVVFGDSPAEIVKEVEKEKEVIIDDLVKPPAAVVNDDRKPKPQKPKPKPQKPHGKPQKPKPQKPGSGRPQKPGSGKPHKPGNQKPHKPAHGRPQKPGSDRPQRPNKPQKPGKPQKPHKPGQKPHRTPESGESLKTETTTFEYVYDDGTSTIDPEYFEEHYAETTQVPDFAVPHEV